MQASQEVPGTLTITNAFLLLTVIPKFDKIASKAIFENAESLTSHTKKQPLKSLHHLLLLSLQMLMKFRWTFSGQSTNNHGQPIATHDQPTCHGEKDGQDGKTHATTIEDTSEGTSLGQSVMVFNDP